jgi:hypothetical protein
MEESTHGCCHASDIGGVNRRRDHGDVSMTSCRSISVAALARFTAELIFKCPRPCHGAPGGGEFRRLAGPFIELKQKVGAPPQNYNIPDIYSDRDSGD